MREVPLTQGKVALVDDEDHERVAAYNWWATFNYKHWYAIGYVDKKKVYMHNFIMGDKPIDHKNRNGLDNQRYNLRKCTQAQNNINARIRSDNVLSGFKGVTMNNKNLDQWTARIYIDKKKVHLGCFSTPEEAARAYDAAAKEHYGEFARPNFVEAL